MYSSISRHKWLVLGALLLVSACGDDDSDFLVGENISGLQFEFFHQDEGIHPSNKALENPRNPFRDRVISDETKFAILTDGGNAGAFYAWATLLARVPTGEHQYYAATKLRDIYDAREVEGPERDIVRQMAIRAYQAVLDNFPDSVTFDATATQTFRLATPALLGILDLNGDVEGDWVLVQDQNGELVAVQGGDSTRPGDE